MDFRRNRVEVPQAFRVALQAVSVQAVLPEGAALVNVRTLPVHFEATYSADIVRSMALKFDIRGVAGLRRTN